jgi:hypothetical protein
VGALYQPHWIVIVRRLQAVSPFGLQASFLA